MTSPFLSRVLRSASISLYYPHLFNAVLLMTALLVAPAKPAAAQTEAKGKAAPASPVSKQAGIDWFKGDVDAAFAKARATGKPLFLYWGAIWCPYCNQVKATVFTGQAFIERSRFFIPVELDGDTPGAQKLGARFKVRGYPTIILFAPDGRELTRLPGEIDPARYLQALSASMSPSARSAKETLQAALSQPASLTAGEWRLLAFYSWSQGEQDLLPDQDLPGTLMRLAASAPAGESADRLALAALVAAAGAKPAQIADFDRATALTRTLKLLSDKAATRAHMDIFVNSADKVFSFLTPPGSADRATLAQALQTSLLGLSADTTLSRSDRVTALGSMAAVARLALDGAPFAPSLLQSVRQGVASADKATPNVYERQAVIYAAAQALLNADLLDDAETLLKAELKRSHSPYYYMSMLGGVAKRRGDTVTALNWYEQAYANAKGPATRVRWGAIYANNVLDLSPLDDARIERAVGALFDELKEGKDTLYEASLARVTGVSRKLLTWQADAEHGPTFARLKARLDAICAALPEADPQRASCTALLVAKGPR